MKLDKASRKSVSEILGAIHSQQIRDLAGETSSLQTASTAI